MWRFFKVCGVILMHKLVMSPSRNFPAQAEPSRAGALQFSS